ncbi:putative sporulation protein YyaC [Paenibacillus sp. DS2015]|uniref:spore protease YyaC n=1 Tax=Paenibacillus sp. DS2015 TaxID=3373917 RepID=UPI003D1F6C46
MQDTHFIPGIDISQRQKINEQQLVGFFEHIYEQYTLQTITFLCIGTDRSTGDALGPLVGNQLVEYGVPNVVGTLPFPCDADNLKARFEEIPSDHIIIAIDACLGQVTTVGSYLVSQQPLIPAESVGLSLPPVGHYSVAAVVNINGPKPYWTLQMTSLYLVMKMAEQISSSIAKAFKLIK